MSNFPIKDPPQYSSEMRKLETTDPVHADVFNELFAQLINNDAFLEALAQAAAGAIEEHVQNGEVHVSTTEKAGWDAKPGAVAATKDMPGLMSAEDKGKLDGIAAGAEVNQNAFSNIKVGTVTITANGKTATYTLEAGANITLTGDNAAKKIIIAANRDGGNADRLNGYHADDLLKTIGNGKVTVKQNGVKKAEFTLNQAGDAEVDLTDTTYGTASATENGLMTTGTQTLAGNKTFNGQVSCAGASAVGTAQARNIYAGTADMTPGTTALATGTIYAMYE